MKTLITNELENKLFQKRTSPDYKLVSDLVFHVHQSLCKHELPIDLSFINQFENLKIKTYSWFANLHNISLEKTIQYLNSNSGCCYFLSEKNQYLILYNNLIESSGHIRWTLAHELGHYLLKHNEICNQAILGKNTIHTEEYKIYEQEANAFARELLAPLNVLTCITDPISPQQIMNLCDLSAEASDNIFNFFTRGNDMGVNYFYETDTTKLFRKFIDNFIYLNYDYSHWQNILTKIKEDRQIILYTSLVNAFLIQTNNYVTIEFESISDFTKHVLRNNIGTLKKFIKNEYGKDYNLKIYDIKKQETIYDDLDEFIKNILPINKKSNFLT